MAKTVETHFNCAACEKRQPLVKEGADNFHTARDEGRLCMSCVRVRDGRALQAGRITMRLVRSEAKGWCAVSLGGKITFKLNPNPAGEAAMLSTPSFTDRSRQHWKGRVYPGNGTAHFQRKSKPSRESSPARRRARKESTAS